jgi:hypothetical protein
MVQMRAVRRRTRFRPPDAKPYTLLSLSELSGVPAKAINALEEVGTLTVPELLSMSLSDLAVGTKPW